jgi:hypothetical protein
MIGEPAPVFVLTPLGPELLVTVYMIPVALAFQGLLKVTVACPSPAFAQTPAGAAGVPFTTTVKELVPLLPLKSVAVQVTVVDPIWKFRPDAGVQLTGRAPSTLSRADVDVEKVTTAPLALVAPTVMLGGTVTTGGLVVSPLHAPPADVLQDSKVT